MSVKHILTYVISIIISLVCIGVSFVEPCQHWCDVLCGIGTSGIGAVLLAIFIDLCNIRQKKAKIEIDRESILGKLKRDIFQIIANEVTILEKEDKEFKDTIENKTIATISELIIDEYSQKYKLLKIEQSENIEFYEKYEQAFEIRKKTLSHIGGYINLVIDDITNNRGEYIVHSILSNDEIEQCIILQILFNGLKKMESYYDYISVFVMLLSKLHFGEKDMFYSIGNRVKIGSEFYDKGKPIEVFTKDIIEDYEIQI